MVRTPFAWCLSPPKRNFPSVAVALPHTGQWIAHKWLDALKLRWSTRQAKTSAGLNMLQKKACYDFLTRLDSEGQIRTHRVSKCRCFF